MMNNRIINGTRVSILLQGKFVPVTCHGGWFIDDCGLLTVLGFVELLRDQPCRLVAIQSLQIQQLFVREHLHVDCIVQDGRHQTQKFSIPLTSITRSCHLGTCITFLCRL